MAKDQASNHLDDVTELELAVAEAGFSPQDRVLSVFARSSVIALGTPSGDTSVPRQGTESDLLHFTVDYGLGTKERTILPVWLDPGSDSLRKALRRNREWQRLLVLEVDGGGLVANIDDDENDPVMVVIDPWTPSEYKIDRSARRRFARAHLPRPRHADPQASMSLGMAIASADISASEWVLGAVARSDVQVLVSADASPAAKVALDSILRFDVDDADGIQRITLPIWHISRDDALQEAVEHRPDWRALTVTEVSGLSLITNIEDDVTLMIDPWTRTEFIIDPEDRQDYLRDHPMSEQSVRAEDDYASQDVTPEVQPWQPKAVPTGQVLRGRLDSIGMPPEIRAQLEDDLVVVESAWPSDSADSSSQRNRKRLELICSLPWNERVSRPVDLQTLRNELDAAHYGMDVAKQAILEYVAVNQRRAQSGRPSGDGLALCLVGPPGVGKTTVVRSIAKGLGRPMESISLGGFSDAQTLRGFHQTYVGARVGAVMNAVVRLGALDGVLRLDELEKTGTQHDGANPADVFLELLDPEQSTSFRDHYLDIPFDLSELMIIGTANDLETVHPALRDRFEVIELPAYTDDEKLVILSRYILPRLRDSYCLTDDDVSIPADVLEVLVSRNPDAPGVRQLERDCRKLLSRAALLLQEGDDHVSIEIDTVTAWLGEPTRRRVVGFAPGDRQ